MGLSLDFYAGDAAAIGGHAVTEVDFDGIRDGTEALAYVDFSLHLHATDLDALSEVVAERLGVGPLLLSECLISEVGSIDDGQTGEADVVDPDWVEMVPRCRGRRRDRGRPVVRGHDEGPPQGDGGHRGCHPCDRRVDPALSGGEIREHEVVHVWYL